MEVHRLVPGADFWSSASDGIRFLAVRWTTPSEVGADLVIEIPKVDVWIGPDRLAVASAEQSPPVEEVGISRRLVVLWPKLIAVRRPNLPLGLEIIDDLG
jgi:hypothetical protein